LDRDILKDLLFRLSKNEVTVDATLEKLTNLPFEDLGFACVDHHRSLRRGISEVIFGEGKEVDDILAIMERMEAEEDNVLITRLKDEKAVQIQERFPQSVYHKRARALTLIKRPVENCGRGTILVMSAGTSDIPMAEEAAVTARFMGNEVDTVFDVGISGLHRILGHWEKITNASVIVVAAGMEGALPGVVGGLVKRPVIALPTSGGYGASFHGLAALLGMLNSCSSGVTVVNIDNGFGAGYAAGLINKA